MYFYVCLTSLLLTLHLSSLRASNFTSQNVQEKNSQNISYYDIFENTTTLDVTLETDEISTQELEASSTVADSTEIDSNKFLPLPPQHTSKERSFTNATSSLSPEEILSHSTEHSSVTFSGSDTPTEENSANVRLDPTLKEENFDAKNEVSKTEITTRAGDDFTTSVSALKSDIVTVKYEKVAKAESTQTDALLYAERVSQSASEHQGDTVAGDLALTYSETTATVAENASLLTINVDNVTSFEETVEHNAILTTDFDPATDKTQSIVVGHKCTRIFQESILWNVTDGGMLALKSCPPGYQGNMYRPCFSNGKWGNVDYSECRLEHLGRMRHMIFHQVQKGMLGNMYVLADEFSKYISSVDMKSPMDRLEAFEILNTFLKLDMSLKMDKSRDIKYIQSLLYSCNELIKKKTVLFSPGSQKNKLITEKAVEMIFDLTYFAEKALRGLLKTQKKQIAFRSTSNVVLYLYRGKLSRQFPLMNFSSEYERDDELSSYFNLEKTLERSAYALIWVKGLQDLLSMDNLQVNSDVAVATILSPLNSLNHLLHPPTFDIGLRMRKEIPNGYSLKCGQLWNMSHLWNTDDCIKASRKGDIVTCRCHHLGSISLLLEEEPQSTFTGPSPPVGKLITVSCVTSLSATILTLVINFLLRRRDQSLSIFILINLLVCLAAIQITFMLGVNKTDRFEICLSFAVLLHYLFLVSCFWVVSYSIYLLQRLRSCMEYVGKIRDYCVFCWMLPTLLLIVSFVGNPNGYETKQFCWLNVQRGILWSFVIPVTGLILVNTIVMILALKTFNEQMSVTHRIEICKTRNSMRAGITLLPFFAINWFFGILAVEDSENMILQAIFALTNSFQGILTFIFFCVMDNNVQMLFRLKFHEVSRKPKVSAMRLKKSGSFPILERPLITLTDDNRRNDCTPLLSHRTTYSEVSEDPCCSNIRV